MYITKHEPAIATNVDSIEKLIEAKMNDQALDNSSAMENIQSDITSNLGNDVTDKEVSETEIEHSLSNDHSQNVNLHYTILHSTEEEKNVEEDDNIVEMKIENDDKDIFTNNEETRISVPRKPDFRSKEDEVEKMKNDQNIDLQHKILHSAEEEKRLIKTQLLLK